MNREDIGARQEFIQTYIRRTNAFLNFRRQAVRIVVPPDRLVPFLMCCPEIGSFNRRVVPHLLSGTVHGNFAVFEHVTVIGHI